MLRQDTRPLTVYGNTWEYKIGRNTIAIYDPEGNRYFPKFTDIVDTSVKGFQLNPSTILSYIENGILAKKWEIVKMNKCGHCKKRKPDVICRTNPYLAEIEGIYTKEYLCNDCTSEIAETI